MTKCRPEPCSSCPYRTDVPSGVWSEDEYEKLRAYDEPTSDQPLGPFHCHATPDFLCHGWTVVHTIRAAQLGREYDLLALRAFPLDGPVPESDVILFGSGNEAADHGQAEIEAPSIEARITTDRLERKYPRLQRG